MCEVFPDFCNHANELHFLTKNTNPTETALKHSDNSQNIETKKTTETVFGRCSVWRRI